MNSVRNNIYTSVEYNTWVKVKERVEKPIISRVQDGVFTVRIQNMRNDAVETVITHKYEKVDP